jgi:sugar phosphate isomerase/epimerase
MPTATFGLSGAHIAHSSPAEAIDRCVALSLDSIELFTQEYTPDECREIRDRCGDAGLIVDYHAPWGGDLDLSPNDHDTALRNLESFIARADLMGVDHLTCHLGLYDLDVPGGRDRALDMIISVTEKVVPSLKDTGVVLCYEDNTLCHDPNPLGNVPRDFHLVFEAVDSPFVGMTLDTGHANVTGNLRIYLDQFGKRIHFVHLNDNDGFGDLHIAPSSGTIDWEQAFEWMSFYGIEGSFSLEFNEQYVALELPILRDLASAYDWRGRA